MTRPRLIAVLLACLAGVYAVAGVLVRNGAVQVGGKRIYWDNSWKCPRSREDLGTIHGETIGPSKGAFDLCPMPGGPAK